MHVGDRHQRVRDRQPRRQRGSDRARRARYRVKDFAAFYLARIVGRPLAWEPDRARRDAVIATLRARL
jgi:hypothetical protein